MIIMIIIIIITEKKEKKGVKIRNNFEGFIYQLAQSRNEVSWLSRELAQE